MLSRTLNSVGMFLPAVVNRCLSARVNMYECAWVLMSHLVAACCRETTEGLGRMIARELQPPVLADKLDLGEVGSKLGMHTECQ